MDGEWEDNRFSDCACDVPRRGDVVRLGDTGLFRLPHPHHRHAKGFALQKGEAKW